MTATTVTEEHLVRAASLSELRATGRLVAHVDRHTICLFAVEEEVHAVDNRCPHMGFPLHRGTVCDGILTCHWHHARFDLRTGGTFDQWADELRRFPVRIEGDDVLVDLRPLSDPASHHRERLRDGLERDIPLVLAKATIALLEADPSARSVFRRASTSAWTAAEVAGSAGLTTLTCFANLLPWLDPADRALALYQGLADVAEDSVMGPPRFPLDPLPGAAPEVERLGSGSAASSRYGTQRARSGRSCRPSEPASPPAIADILFAAATDHRYLDGGHTLDFVNKALEALDLAGWESAEAVLASLPAQLAFAERMEEANAWRNPVDVVAVLEQAFEELPRALAEGQTTRGSWSGRTGILEAVLGDEPKDAVEALLGALWDGASEVELASAVSFAAASRIARFPTSNEFGDWDTALHTFTFANAVEQGLRRSPSIELLRGVLDAAMSVHLDRFLNVPATRLPVPDPDADPAALLQELPLLLDHLQQVDEAAALVGTYLASGGEPARLVAALGAALVRENRNFHTIQCTEAAVRQHELLAGSGDEALPLIAAARYLAAHAATTRSQHQTFDIARRLHRGERLYEDAELSAA